MPLIVVRVTVPVMTVDELVARCARWFRDEQVVFVPTEGVQPSGRRVRFVFALPSGQEVITGEGYVLRMRRDSGDPRRPSGMELRYELADDASAALVERILQAKKTPPPYVSMRIDRAQLAGGVAIEPTMLATPLPPPPRATPARLATLPPASSPDAESRGWRLVGVGLATAAAVLAVALAAAMMRRAPPSDLARGPRDAGRAPVAVGGNGLVSAPPPATALADPPPPPPVSAHAIALRIHTSPAGAVVFVDGQERGPAPLTVTVGDGAHDVVAERPRWMPAHAHVDRAGRVDLKLTRPPARLRVTSTPPGARVFLDGVDVGLTPLELDAAAFELHHLRIEYDGRVWKRRLYLKPDGAAVRVGARAPSVDEPGAVRVAHDLGERVRP